MKKIIAIFIMAFSLSGCFREMPMEHTPIHLNQNMDDQEKFEPYEENPFFDDNSAMRMPVEGTIARGDLVNDTARETGKSANGSLVTKNPIAVTTEIMERGQERFNIYCRPCHGAVGDGQGIAFLRARTKGFVPPTDLTSELIRNQSDGHLFDVITNGIRNMQSYRYQITTDDRWAIVHYLRALQRSQHGQMKDVPASMRDKVN